MRQKADNRDEQDDATLVALVLSGKREAFDALLLRYSASVLRLCAALLGTTQEAQDVAQEATLQAFLGLARLREPSRFGAWFHTIAANLARSALRRHREVSLYVLPDDEALQILWSHTSPTLEDVIAAHEINDDILTALQALSEVNRQAIVGFYLEGYSYGELAQLLGVSVSTVKGRLFQGRQQLKASLQPLADSVLRPTDRQRKEYIMDAPELTELQIDSLRTLLLTRQRLVILRDPQSERGLPIQLTQAEADALSLALDIQRDKDGHPFPQDLSQRLLESLEAQVQQIVVNTLAEQTFYATLTLTQGKRTREVDVRLSDALALAVRTGAPIYATHQLLTKAATLDLTVQSSEPSRQEIQAMAKDAQNLGREERMRLEEFMRRAIIARRRGRPDEHPDWLWAFLLEGLTGTRDAISLSELQAIDVSSTFTPREVMWDEQPMVALRLPDQRETAWILVQPGIWHRLAKAFQQMQETEPTVLQASEPAKPAPDTLSPEQQRQAEGILARLIEEGALRDALLLNPEGKLAVWQGADTQETLLRFSSALSNDMAKHKPLANEHELGHQLGHQPQKVSMPYGNKHAVLQELPVQVGGIIATGIYQNWRLVVVLAEKPARDLSEEVHQRISLARRELTEMFH